MRHCRQWMAKLGVRTIEELVGRVDLLETDEAIKHWKSDGLDLTAILKPAKGPGREVGRYKQIEQDHGIALALDNELIKKAEPALRRGEKVVIESKVGNTDRVVGTMLSHQVSKAHGADGLPDGTIHLKLTGAAGQSLGAWAVKGVTLELEGDANDYVGKGLSGGRIIIYPPRHASFAAEDNIIIGNVALYGATSGKAFVRGVAAERFCVRNSGAWAVVEGVGDHGCEYMTGGRAVILGPTGRNFAAGMSGGIAYVLDEAGDFLTKCNLEMVDLEKVDNRQAQDELRLLIEEHVKLTGSAVGQRVLDDWTAMIDKFVRVMPRDYKRYLQGQTIEHADPETDEHVESGAVAASTK